MTITNAVVTIEYVLDGEVWTSTFVGVHNIDLVANAPIEVNYDTSGAAFYSYSGDSSVSMKFKYKDHQMNFTRTETQESPHYFTD